MNSVEIKAKTVDDAIEEAVKKLGVREENLQIEIIHEPSSGFLGIIGQKDALVRASVKMSKEENLKKFLDGLLVKMGIEGDILLDTDEQGNIIANIQGEEMGILIGKRGQTLNALQYLCNVAHHRQFKDTGQRIIVDVEDYRNKRKKTLEQLAKNLAKKAIRQQKEVVLEPMNSMERRVIHMVLKNYAQVTTKSLGDEPFRKVVIIPK